MLNPRYFFRKALVMALPLVFLLTFLEGRGQDDGLGASLNPDLKGVEYQFKFLEAQRMKVTGNLQEAGDLLNACILLDPKNPVAFFELANLSGLNQDPASALRYIVRACELDPSNLWYQLLRARILMGKGQTSEGIKVFEKMARQFELSEEIWLEMASGYVRAGKLRDAIKVFDRLEEIYGIREEYCISRERLFITLGKDKKALDEIRKLITAFPGESRYYGMLADAYAANNMDDKAFATYQKLFEMDPDNGMGRLSYSAFLQKLGQWNPSFEELKKAFASPDVPVELKVEILQPMINTNDQGLNEDLMLTLVNMLVETHPDQVLAHGIRADYLLAVHQTDEAIEELELILSLDKKNYYVWEKLLILLSDKEDFQSLFDVSSEAVELFPLQPLVYFLKGSSAFQLKKTDEAIKSLEAGLDLVVDNVPLKIEFYRYLGEAYFKRGEFPKGDRSFDTLLDLDSTQFEVMNNYAYYLAVQGRQLEKARSLAQKALASDAEDASFIDTYGWVLYKMGDWKGAVEQLRKAVMLSGKRNPVLLEHLGDALYKLGDDAGALEMWYLAREKGAASDALTRKITEKRLSE